ncbi:hypothetical protein BGX28_005817 [Mortierella sp. GBA30]|nr:hypothetical protein BGX28_005817 [Mortierella sp. GBA30]
MSKKEPLQQLKDLSIFFLPKDVLASLVPKTPSHTTINSTATSIGLDNVNPASYPVVSTDGNGSLPGSSPALNGLDLFSISVSRPKALPSCRTCGIAKLSSVEEQREHVKSDWHRYNLKHRLLNTEAKPIPEDKFKNMLQDVSDIPTTTFPCSPFSSSESYIPIPLTHVDLDNDVVSRAHDDQFHSLIQRLEVTVREEEQCRSNDPVLLQQQQLLDKKLVEARMSPMIWFTSTLYGPSVKLGIYKNTLANRTQGCSNPLELVQSIQIPLPPLPPKKKKVRRAARITSAIANEQSSMQEQNKPDNDISFMDTQDVSSMNKADRDPQLVEKLNLVQQLETTLNEPPPKYWTLILLGGGHFAGMVIDLRGGTNNAACQVRKKQGGAQSTHGGCNSAGAMVRMYNERALKLEVRELLERWSQWIQQSEFVFMHAPGNNHQTLYYEGSSITKAEREGRVRSIPFVTRRPTLAELKRVYEELATVKVKVEMTLGSDSDVEVDFKEAHEVEEEEEEDVLSDALEGSVASNISTRSCDFKEETPLQQQLTAEAPSDLRKLIHMVMKGRAEAMSNYLSRTGMDPSRLLPDMPTWGYNRARTPTLLHLASLHGQAGIVQQLLERYHANPTATLSSLIARNRTVHAYQHEENVSKDMLNLNVLARPSTTTATAYDLAKDKDTRNAFRSAMAKMPEAWDWIRLAHVPSAYVPKLTPREQRQSEGDIADIEENEVEERGDDRRVALQKEVNTDTKQKVLETSHPKPRGNRESRMILDRERRAQAAEARLALSRAADVLTGVEQSLAVQSTRKPMLKGDAATRTSFNSLSNMVPHTRTNARMGKSNTNRRHANNGNK